VNDKEHAAGRKHKIYKYLAIFLLVILAAGLLFVLAFQDNTRDWGLSEEWTEKVLPLKDQKYFEYLVDELVRLKNYSDVDLVKNTLDSIVADGNLTEEEVISIRDLDGDYITNEIEFEENTDPFNAYTSGTTLDDFNALYTYGVHPRDQEAVTEILESIPNVKDKVRIWTISWGEFWYVNSTMSDGGTPLSQEKGLEISARDPLIRYYAERAEIRWTERKNMTHANTGLSMCTRMGPVFVDGEPLHVKYGGNELTESGVSYNSYQASLYFVYGRMSTCGPSSIANAALFRAMGLDAINVEGDIPDNNPTGTASHGWSEVVIDGEVYVCNFNTLLPRDAHEGTYGYYEFYNWSPYPNLYDPDWYKQS
jgi:hypothetical protein